MAKQKNIPDKLLSYEKEILDLERDYTKLLAEFLQSDDFLKYFSKVFTELNKVTEEVLSIYDGSNIINTPAERLITYCIYSNFFKRQSKKDDKFKTVECYSYPICGDLAVELEEVVLSIEVKTVSKNSNKVDIATLQFRPNQTSFTNLFPYPNADTKLGYKPILKIPGHIPHYYKNKPVLTFTIEIIYDYDSSNPLLPFKPLEGTFKNCTALNLFCVPNGELGRLFDDNIFHGIKTYSYYDNTSNSSSYYDIIELDNELFPNITSCNKDVKAVYQYLYDNIDKVDENWKIAHSTKNVVMIDTAHKGAEWHERQGTLWVLVKRKGKSPVLRAIKSHNSCRIDWQKNLVDRYDSNGNDWKGVHHITV